MGTAGDFYINDLTTTEGLDAGGSFDTRIRNDVPVDYLGVGRWPVEHPAPLRRLFEGGEGQGGEGNPSISTTAHEYVHPDRE